MVCTIATSYFLFSNQPFYNCRPFYHEMVFHFVDFSLQYYSPYFKNRFFVGKKKNGYFIDTELALKEGHIKPVQPRTAFIAWDDKDKEKKKRKLE